MLSVKDCETFFHAKIETFFGFFEVFEWKGGGGWGLNLLLPVPFNPGSLTQYLLAPTSLHIFDICKMLCNVA